MTFQLFYRPGNYFIIAQRWDQNFLKNVIKLQKHKNQQSFFWKDAVIRTQSMILTKLFGVDGRSSNMAIRCELGAFPVVLRCYTLMFNYFLRFSESGGLMDGIHNILKAAFAEDQLLLKKENSW